MRTRGALILIGLISIISFLPNLVLAQQQKDFTLSPLRTEYSIEPGTSRQGELTISNPSNKEVTVSLSAEAFGVVNPEYDYSFDAESRIVSWVRFSEQTLVLSPGGSVKVQYTVAVPVAAEPGGRYISLFASSDTESSETSAINSRQRIGSLLYITVLGDVTREGHLLSLNSPLLISAAGSWSMTLQNTGTTHFRSRYSVSTRTLFNTEVTSTSGDALILPGTVRLLTGDIKLPDYPGIYKVVYTIGLGDTPAVAVTKYQVYLPPVFFLGAVAVAVVAVLSRRFIKSRRHKN